jgi:hypothetical protein
MALDRDEPVLPNEAMKQWPEYAEASLCTWLDYDKLG